MYSFGGNLNLRPVKNADNIKHSYHLSSNSPKMIKKMVFRHMNKYKEACLVEQSIAEIRYLQSLRNNSDKRDASEDIKVDLNYEYLCQGRYKYFLDAMSWIEYTKTVDLGIGGRLHGGIAHLLGGCPNIFIIVDGRMRELADYHGFPSIPYFEITGDEKVEDLLIKLDIDKMQRIHKRNYDRYIEFLNKNGLSHI